MKLLYFVTCILFIIFATGNGDDHQVVDAPALAPVPAPDCAEVVYDMLNCISYLSAGSDDKKPDETCCQALPLVLAVDKSCICVAVKDSIDMGINLNLTRVALLPSICKVAAPPLTSCGVDLSPLSPISNAPSPAMSPSEAPGAAPAKAPGAAPAKATGAAQAEAPVKHNGDGSNPPASSGSKSPAAAAPKPSIPKQVTTAAPPPPPAKAPIKAAANPTTSPIPIFGLISSSSLVFASFFCFILV